MTWPPRRLWLAGGALLAAVLTALFLWRVYAAGQAAGHNGRDKEVAALTADLATARRNQAALEQSLARQAATLAKLATAGAAARQIAAEAENRAAEARGQTEALRQRLDTQSRQATEKPAIALNPDQKEAWNALD